MMTLQQIVPARNRIAAAGTLLGERWGASLMGGSDELDCSEKRRQAARAMLPHP